MAVIKEGVLIKVGREDLKNGHFKTPAEVTSIASNAFLHCQDKLRSLFISANVTKLEDFACCDCQNLNFLVFFEGIIHIGQHAFSGCTNLPSVILPPGLISIDESAFFECTNISVVKFPESILYIDKDAFWGCNQNFDQIIINTSSKNKFHKVRATLPAIFKDYNILMQPKLSLAEPKDTSPRGRADSFFSKGALNIPEDTSQRSAAPSQF